MATNIEQPIITSTITAMPARNHSSAPSFDASKPRELPLYFEELETLMRAANITTGQLMKEQAKRYVSREDGELWAALPEYGQEYSYEDFKKAVLKLYPGADEERRYTMQDVDKLVGERLRIGMLTLEDLASYYRQFYAMTKYLVDKARMSSAEQSRAFLRGFQNELLSRISQRLQLKFPDHHPDDPFTLEQIYAAAQYVMHGVSAIGVPRESPLPNKPVKNEDIYTLFDRLSKNLVSTLQAAVPASSSSSQAAAPAPTTIPRPAPSGEARCNFCGDATHFIGRCPVVEQYIAEGKIRRNPEGRVILSGGGWISRQLAGQWLKDKVDEWHRLNPGQLVRGQLSSNMNSTMFFDVKPPTILKRPSTEDQSAYQLFHDVDDQIGKLQQEILALEQRKKKVRFDGVDVPRYPWQNRKDKAPEVQRPTPNAEVSVTPAVSNGPVLDSVPVQPTQVDQSPTTVQPSASSASGSVTSVPVIHPVAGSSSGISTQSKEAEVESPVHPYSKAKDANYLPPMERNFAGKGKDPAYRTVAPIQDPKIAEEVYSQTLKTPAVTLSYGELLSLAPEVRWKYQDALTPKRQVINKPAAYTMDDALPFSANDSSMYEEGVVVPDPVEVYLNFHGELPSNVKVAAESSMLRALVMQVKGQDIKAEVECILDGGSSVIAISEALCQHLGLAYDPKVQLPMESANGGVDHTLGLARNVPFRIQDITLFLQVHVVRHAAYDVLLG